MSKSIVFLGDALECLRAFPQGARRRAGFQLDKVQQGLPPDDWKPMTTIGNGANEIRVRDGLGIWRVIYVATLPEAVYVLHAFQKKGRKTTREDIELARMRYRQLIRVRR